MWEVIHFDYNKIDLFWFETPKSNEVIDSLIKAIKSWVELPLFHVFEFEEWKFSLSPKEKIIVNWKEFVDWWHHRAIAYLKTNIVFPVIKTDKPLMPVHMLQRWYINIKDIPLVDSYDEYLKRSNRYWNYL